MVHARPFRAVLAVAGGLLVSTLDLAAQVPRPTETVDDHVTAKLFGNVHPLARAEFDAGPVPANEPMQRMILVLAQDPAKAMEISRLLDEQQDPMSVRYHAWLTPAEYGRRFGIADDDLNLISHWLTERGFQIDGIPAGRVALLFSGTVAQVEEAFHTEMRYYRVNGVLHRANATNPEIPAALQGIVAGIASLHDFESSQELAGARSLSVVEFTSGSGAHHLSPADFATIYDVSPLYSGLIDGRGQSIAVVARSNVLLSDIRTFRSMTGLPPGDAHGDRKWARPWCHLWR